MSVASETGTWHGMARVWSSAPAKSNAMAHGQWSYLPCKHRLRAMCGFRSYQGNCLAGSGVPRLASAAVGGLKACFRWRLWFWGPTSGLQHIKKQRQRSEWNGPDGSCLSQLGHLFNLVNLVNLGCRGCGQSQVSDRPSLCVN